MACVSESVSLYFDVNGKPTGEFKIKCSGDCTGTEKCDWVRHPRYKDDPDVSAIFCHCTAVRDGVVDHWTPLGPPGHRTRCEDSIGIVCTVKGDTCELKPTCFGSCDDDGFECKPDDPKSEWITIETPGGGGRMVRVETYKCVCKHK
jgi:hypothetical protein